jgi:hypothetical protein
MTHIYAQPPAQCDSVEAVQNVVSALSVPVNYVGVDKKVVPADKAYFLASVWIKDAYSPEGVSGGTWIGVNNHLLYVHASGAWRNLYHHDITPAVLVIPVQQGELDNGAGAPLFIKASLRFEGFSDSSSVRLAMFSLHGISQDQAGAAETLQHVLDQRALVTTMNPNQPDIEI